MGVLSSTLKGFGIYTPVTYSGGDCLLRVTRSWISSCEVPLYLTSSLYRFRDTPFIEKRIWSLRQISAGRS